MKRNLKLWALALLALTVTVEVAEAKRRMRLPVAIPVPRTHTTSHAADVQREVVKVLDLPNTAAFQQDDGSYVDLGYHFFSDESGEWVGYIGSSKDYLSLSEEQLSGIMRIADLKELPAAPTRSSGSWSGGSHGGSGGGSSLYYWIFVLIVIFGVRFLKGAMRGASVIAGVAGKVAAKATSVDDRQGAAWMNRAEGQMLAKSGLAPTTASHTRKPDARPAFGSSTAAATEPRRVSDEAAAAPVPAAAAPRTGPIARSSSGNAGSSGTVIRGGRVSVPRTA